MASKATWNPVERLRRIWTPQSEVYERIESLDPQTELDSKIRDLFSRLVERIGSIELDLEEPPTGYIRWEEVTGIDGRRYVTVWHLREPE